MYDMQWYSKRSIQSFMCFVQFSRETYIISLKRIETLAFVMDTDCVTCDVKTYQTLYVTL